MVGSNVALSAVTVDTPNTMSPGVFAPLYVHGSPPVYS